MRVAVVGAGIAGLGAAHALRDRHEVTVFEKASRFGGHARTISHQPTGGGHLGLDTGFLVYNECTYPNLTRLFRELGVATQPSEMSFAVRCRRHGLTYSGRSLRRQVRNLRRRGFARLAVDIARWQLLAPKALAPDAESLSLRDFVRLHRFSAQFSSHFLIPFTAALWSSGTGRALDLPASFAVRFFANHGMLGWRGRLPWRTVVGGSATYVKRLVERIGHERCREGVPVRAVSRGASGVAVRLADDHLHAFDAVILATHADQALSLLTDASKREADVLGTFGYTTSEAVLHTDSRQLPDVDADRSSWNFELDDCTTRTRVPAVTYSLNRLQAIRRDEQYCISLNRTDSINPSSVLDRVEFEHPVFDAASVAAQQELRLLSGTGRVFYAGAHHGSGFHEDGLVSGLRAAELVGQLR